MSDLMIMLQGERVHLLPEHGIYRERNRTLYVADLHVGKAETFRAERIAIPHGTTRSTLARLESALERTRAMRLVILGDFFHARTGRHADALARLQRWRELFAHVTVELVRGNHDRHAGDPDAILAIRCCDAPVDDNGWALRHHPGPAAGEFWLAGHVHPAVRLSGPAHQSFVLPCFYESEAGMILPAFGDFTGRAEIDPAPSDRVFVVAETDVIEWPTRSGCSPASS